MDLPVIRFGRLELKERKGLLKGFHPNKRLYTAIVDGHEHACTVGAWAVWIPDLRAKFLHSVEGFVHCIHKDAPARADVLSASDPTLQFGRYALAEWRAAYSKAAQDRTNELALCTQLLHRAGIGPGLIGICRAEALVFNGETDSKGAWGIVTEDVTLLPKKQDTTEEEVIRAGVQPDRIKSCIRQQLNGYVIDLNSVVGAMPLAADQAPSARG